MIRIINLLSIFLIPSLIILGWGDKGHRLITKHSLIILQDEINLPANLSEKIIHHCIDPDYRKKDDLTEPNKHFIDIDYYEEFLNGNMITSYDSIISVYGDSIVINMGTLPWATEISYSSLVDAFKRKDITRIILYASDLAHYVADGHQPLHTTLNYNGQLTDQKGIHFRHEIDLINNNIQEIESRLTLAKPIYVSNLTGFIFNYIEESNYNVDLILIADKHSYQRSGREYNDNYFKLLWQRVRFVTINSIDRAAQNLASLIYSAWTDAGKPQLDNL